MTQHAGQTAVVTGAASGIGYQIAGRLNAAGATVYAVDLHHTEGERSAGIHSVVADVSDAGDVAQLIDHAVAETGRLDILCNNAGASSVTDPVSCTVEEWDHVFAVNVRGVFLGTKFAVPHMLRQGGGVIVNTASAAGLVGLPDRAAYCASKGAVIAFTRQVAVQYARAGIRCNCVCPGTVDSPWVARLLHAAKDRAQAREALIARQPMGRLGTPEEIADAVMYLVSPAASFITGSSLVIDGGIVAG